MLKPGDRIRSLSGKTYTVKNFISAGGQGEAYTAAGSGGRDTVAKLYHPHFHNDDSRRRLRHLLDQNFQAVCPTLFSPDELVDGGGALGHVTPKAPGQALELLTTGSLDLLDGLQIGVALAHSFAVLHQRGLAHGDPHSNNVLVYRNGGCHVHLIDFDNYTCSGLPPAPCLGHHLYMAPEIRRHHAPPSPEKTNSTAGYPTEILDANLARLFRAGVSTKPSDRPSAATWRDALYEAMFKIYVCPHCNGPNLIDTSKSVCAMCRKPYPILALEGGFGRIKLDRASIVVGRKELGGSEKISQKHAVIRRIGPEYRIEDRSSNGIARRTSSGWVRLPRTEVLEKQPLIRDGDVLRFADVECRVVAA